jgi:penicillin-binding protein-related factor A (putative recombinase)
MSTANRGKVAETLVKKRLEVLSKSSSFVWHRFADMRSGVRQVALADFMFVNDGKLALLEVKETQHDFRLVLGNFSADQVARMRMWEAAGCDATVLIYHSTTKLWRRLPVEAFLTRTGGSWDLRLCPTDTLENLL